MPPVFRPVSWSLARLWSMLDTMGLTTLPSVKLSTLTSGPVRNSSTTTWLPEAPNFLSSMISFTPSAACCSFSQISTPLPRARPSALMTTGYLPSALMYAMTLAGSSKVSYLAVGMPYFFIRSLENTLEASMRAAALSGPKAGMPTAASASTMPRASGSSCATTT